jgi:hypothetical protein
VVPISPDGQILIVGSKPSNFERSWLESPRLVFWHSTNARISEQKRLPQHVEAVFFTKFVRHALCEKIQELAKKSGIRFFRFVQGTGEIKRLISESGILNRPIILQPKPETASAPVLPVVPIVPVVPKVATPAIEPGKEKILMKKKKGQLTAFILENANLAVSSPENKKEIQRLWDLARSKGLETTPGSIEVCFYKQRKIAAQPVAIKTKKPVIQKRRGRRRDSTKAIEKFLATIEIVAVAVKELNEENASLRTENKRLAGSLKQLRSLLRKI